MHACDIKTEIKRNCPELHGMYVEVYLPHMGAGGHLQTWLQHQMQEKSLRVQASG